MTTTTAHRENEYCWCVTRSTRGVQASTRTFTINDGRQYLRKLLINKLWALNPRPRIVRRGRWIHEHWQEQATWVLPARDTAEGDVEVVLPTGETRRFRARSWTCHRGPSPTVGVEVRSIDAWNNKRRTDRHLRDTWDAIQFFNIIYADGTTSYQGCVIPEPVR